MIVRRPGTWGTIRGDGTDEDRSRKGIGMSGLQEQQQVKTVESSRPGSSGSSRSSSNSEWGSCSELLLVSAVKKHGIPNWNLVASELKARAVLLNISASCFTEEACKFKYHALKGRFASSGSSGDAGSVSSPEDDLDGGVTWFEELRKLRMSHLKEELQVYDSSIGQLQSRISRLQEERALQEESVVMKQQCDSNCRADSHPKDCKSPDMRPSILTCPSEESFETAHDSALTNAAEGASPAENLPVTSGVLDQQETSVMEVDELQNQRDNPATPIPQRVGQDSTNEVVERGADMTFEHSMHSELPTREKSPQKVADKGEDQVCPPTSTKAFQVREDEIGIGKPDLEISTSTSDEAKVEDQAVSEDQGILDDQAVGDDQATVGDQAILEKPSETPSGEGDVQVRGDGVDSAVAEDSAMPENGATVGWDERAPGKNSEPDMAVSTSSPPAELPSTCTAVELPTRDPLDSLEALGVAIGASSPCRVPEPEASNSIGSLEVVDSSSKRESRSSRLSLSYGRAEKEKRLKAKEEAKLKEMLRPEPPKAEYHLPSESTIEESDVLEVQEKDIKDTSVPVEQSENGWNSPSGSFPMDGVNADESVKQDVVVADSPTRAVGDGAHNCGQCPSNPVDGDDRPSDTDVDLLQAGSDLVSSKRAQPSSPEEEIPLLTVALGPDPELAEPRPSDFVTEVERRKDEVTTILESSPKPDSEEISQEGNLLEEAAVYAAEIANEVKSASGSMVPPETDVKSEGASQEINNLMMENESMEIRQDEEAKLDEVVAVVIEGSEGETLETDLDISRSVDEDVPEILETKGSGNRQEARRDDGTETVEVQQSFLDYTDSQIDKSEVGSSMDSIEDMSPSSRKNRREPKVPGKFLPLLECLRVICAHKFAPLFRQRQEYQDNARYDRLVRRHVDLSMVRARLEDGAYSGSVEFFRDLLLIFTNALVYNRSDSQEYVGAKALRSCALTEMDKILQTEALLKQNGPATRKREVRKSMEVHKARVSSNSAGSEVRKKAILKGSNESPAALDSQGGVKSGHIAFEDTHAGRSSNHNDVDRDLDVKIESTFKKAAANRVFKEETPRKESRKPEFLIESGNRGSGGSSDKKMKVDRDFQKRSLQGQVLADLRASGGRLNVETKGNRTTPAKMKDMICIDMETKGTPNNSSSLVSSGLSVEKQRLTPILRPSSTSRVSRYSKRGGDSTASNAKKRVRK